MGPVVGLSSCEVGGRKPPKLFSAGFVEVAGVVGETEKLPPPGLAGGCCERLLTGLAGLMAGVS